ncbi:MAG: DUF5678 domain-containing protein [Cyanobacteria bacterium J06621_3]
MMTEEELKKYSQYIDRDRLEYMERQEALYEEVKSELMKQYANEYIAFEDGKVLDHDVDEERLAKRVYQKYGYRDLLMLNVSERERVYTVGRFPTA